MRNYKTLKNAEQTQLRTSTEKTKTIKDKKHARKLKRQITKSKRNGGQLEKRTEKRDTGQETGTKRPRKRETINGKIENE